MTKLTDTALAFKKFTSKEELQEASDQLDFENNMESLDQLIEEGLDIAWLGGGREW